MRGNRVRGRLDGTVRWDWAGLDADWAGLWVAGRPLVRWLAGCQVGGRSGQDRTGDDVDISLPRGSVTGGGWVLCMFWAVAMPDPGLKRASCVIHGVFKLPGFMLVGERCLMCPYQGAGSAQSAQLSGSADGCSPMPRVAWQCYPVPNSRRGRMSL
jgi:hypothetical protein